MCFDKIQGTDQNVVNGEAAEDDLAKLLEFINSEWVILTRIRKMRRRIVIPEDIQHFRIGVVDYRLTGAKREIWFLRSGKDYDASRVFVSEAVADKQAWQLELGRRRGVNGDYLVLLQAKRLGGSVSSYGQRGTGRRSPRE